LPDINMKTTGDKHGPWITGLAFLPPNTLIAIDYNNYALKTVDTTTNTVTSQLTFSGQPWDITLLPGDQAAVTIPYKKRLQIISTKDGFSCLRSISVNGQCYGICSTNQNIIVSFPDSAMIQVMDLAGKVIHTLSTDVKGESLFNQPSYVTVSKGESGEVIYVSDFGTNTITKVSMKGKVISTYKQENWGTLRGLLYVGQSQLLVSNCWGHSIDVVSEDGKRICTLLDRTHGIKYPCALCYCASQETLYISSCDNECPVVVFKLSKK